ncbi:unnamed protein product, partial [Didymodactylos carnosus]
QIAETISTGEADKLIELDKTNRLDRERSNDEMMANAMIQNLKNIYYACLKNKIPIVERARLLSLLPRTWKYDQIKVTFNCSDHAIKTAHKMQELEQYMINLDNQKHFRRKASAQKIEHFVTWLVESNTLVPGRDQTFPSN